MNKNELLDFVTPYYADKDVTHNMWHIGLVIKYVEKIVKQGNYAVDHDKLILAAYFHGFIYSHEKEIRNWLAEQRFPERDIELIARISRGSQRPETPETLEGKILHDAHVVEGETTYLITKSLITGTARGQTLVQTIDFIEKHVPDKNKCYLPETIPLPEKANGFAKSFIAELKEGIA